jgi:hypothetical protein
MNILQKLILYCTVITINIKAQAEYPGTLRSPEYNNLYFGTNNAIRMNDSREMRLGT